MRAFRETLRANPALLTAIARCNAPDPADFFPALPPEQAAALERAGLWRCRAGRAALRRWFFRQAGIERFFTDFREERLRLALLDKETLRRLALLYGACLYAEEAARLVRRDDVASLRALLGAHYEFAVLRARFLAWQARDCFAAVAGNAGLAEKIVAVGFAALRLCLADLPDALARLVALRLPPELAADAQAPLPGAPGAADLTALVWADVKKLLLTEVGPQWQACFA